MPEVNYSSSELDLAYEKAGMEKLKEALKRSYTERFLMATRLYKIQKTMDKFTMTRKPFIKK